MPIADRLIHRLAIVTPTTEGEQVDDYGQPVEGEPTVELVWGNLQPKAATEVPRTSEAGAEIATHVVFLAIRPVDPSNAAYIRFEPDDGDRYEIKGVRSYRFGRDPHHEIDTRRITSGVLATAGS